LTYIRDGALMVEAIVPGQHWGIESFTDGHVEIERYFADPAGVLDDESLLDELIDQNRDESSWRRGRAHHHLRGGTLSRPSGAATR
jgi:hypothetical protein